MDAIYYWLGAVTFWLLVAWGLLSALWFVFLYVGDKVAKRLRVFDLLLQASRRIMVERENDRIRRAAGVEDL